MFIIYILRLMFSQREFNKTVQPRRLQASFKEHFNVLVSQLYSSFIFVFTACLSFVLLSYFKVSNR